MYGLAVIIVLYFYIRLAMWIAKKLVGKRESKQWKWGVRAAVALIFVLIPTADSILGHLYFNHLCSTEAGVKVYQTVELPAEYWDENGKPKFFNQYGNLQRDLWINKLDEPPGRVEPYSTVFAIDKDTSFVKERTSQKVLAEVTTFRYWGGWFAQSFTPHNSAASCEFVTGQNFGRNFYGQLFKPATATR